MEMLISNRLSALVNGLPGAIRLLRRSWLLFTIPLLLTIIRPPVLAQTQSANYWQYPASGRLRHVITADVNHDGVDEFLVVDEDGKTDLLSSNGVLQWSYNAPRAVSAITTINMDEASRPDQEVILGLEDKLIALSTTGETLWQVEMSLIAMPLSRLTGSVRETGPVAGSQFQATPTQLLPFDHDGDGTEEILVLMATGLLHLYDVDGTLLWEFPENIDLTGDSQPRMVVGELNNDGRVEIVLGRFDPERRFSFLTLLNGNGRAVWDQDQSVSGRITALSLGHFSEQGKQLVAVGNNLGQVSVFDVDRHRVWQRTLNKPITGFIAAYLGQRQGLVVGTSVGSVVAFDGDGRRVWTRYLAPKADRRIINLSAAAFPPGENQPAISVIVASGESESAPSDVVLLAGNGRTLDSFLAIDTAGLTRLSDINKDKNSELLLARFAQVELLGLGLGASETAKGWDYNLFSEPRSFLVVDLDSDGSDELIVGTQDGRIHSLDGNSSIRWLHAPGGAVTHLAPLANSSEGTPEIVAVRNETVLGLGNELTDVGWLELRQANGRQLWEQRTLSRINTLTVGELNGQGRPEIIAGTADGEVKVYSASGNMMWQSQVNGALQHLLVLEDDDGRDSVIVAATENQVFTLGSQFPPWRIATYSQEILGLYEVYQPGAEPEKSIFVLLQDGAIMGRSLARGARRPQWSLDIGGKPIAVIPVKEAAEGITQQETIDSYVIALDNSQMILFSVKDGRPSISWQLSSLEEATALFWTDLDSDALPEIAVGDADGRVRLLKVRPNNDPEFLVDLNLSSSVFGMTALDRAGQQQADLLVITENGLVQLFRAQDNLPPLLTNPRVDLSQDQYSIFVDVQDKENDDVAVRLEIKDPASDAWITQGERRLTNGKGTLFWLVDDPLSSAEGVNYRFHFDDGFHQGHIVPPQGPLLPPQPASRRLPLSSIGLLIAAAAGVGFLLFRQIQLPTSRARRFYRHLKQQPERTLSLLESTYSHTEGSPDFLLSLANQARQRNDALIAGLSDGLFLLADQPNAGLPIILSALDDASPREPPWQELDRWQKTYKMGQALLETPTVTELTLLRPQLAQLLAQLDADDHWSPILDALLPILTNLRDSERMELAEDRIVYLNEAAALLKQLQENLHEFSTGIEKTLVAVIARRWSGLVTAEIEDLRGRAELAITLKTRRVAPSHQTDIVLEVRNKGRAAAENLIAELDEDPAYLVHSSPQEIRLLPPGRTRQISFTIEPKVQDRFRIALTATYDDRNGRDKAVAFGDMVHLLPPLRDFKPIANPYLPGTPLRRTSPIFYGRSELFSFIAENAGELAQRNVLILVGERRTGKTSVLLRLEQHLPENLVPVYIDCQSLGVLPGMPALLHDLAWYVADALASRGIVLDVPEPAHWQEDPTGRFQRYFLPQVRSLLPGETTLLLVFDEFEAFENLVDDGILPPTLFPYLRHLMQHSQGLSFVFVGTRRLEEMSADYWSVLFNIALYQKIGYLSDESATQLICEPVKPNLIYDDLALDKILRVTTGHPYFLQLVCYTLVKRANAQRSGYATVSDVNAALDEMLRLGEVHFAYLWQRSTPAERALLTAMSHLMDRDAPFHPADLIRYLRPYGISLTPPEVTTALRRLVERDILREVTEGATSRYELRIGLVGLWVARYKSLSMLLTSNVEPLAASLRRT